VSDTQPKQAETAIIQAVKPRRPKPRDGIVAGQHTVTGG
jgi:hypothetical protein